MPLFLTKILGSKWLPYVAGGVLALALVVCIYGYGHMKGSESTELKYLGLMNVALERQMKRNQAVAKADLVAVTVSATRRASLVETIRTITLPAPDVECSDPVWLHAYNDGVRAVNASTQ